MRDPRYTQVKDILAIGPDWSHGCEHCAYGLILAPDIIGAVSVSEQRAVAHIDNMIVYCECRAGHMYRQHLRRVSETLSEYQRNSIRGHMAVANVPTIHGA